MLKYKNEFSIAAMCRVLVVSRSGFYDWLVKQDKPRLLKHRQQQIDAHIAHAFNADKGRSGAIRVMLALDKKGIHYNRKTVALSLQRQGLRAKAARKFKATTQSKHNLPVADNLLKQDFTASQPNQKWAGDITYLWTNEGWYYLAVVLDLYSRKVIGWAMSERMTARLVCDALTMALFRRKHPKGVIVVVLPRPRAYNTQRAMAGNYEGLPEGFPEALVMDDFAGTQEFDGFADIRILDQT